MKCDLYHPDRRCDQRCVDLSNKQILIDLKNAVIILAKNVSEIAMLLKNKEKNETKD